jgi:hypothetical protein
MENLTHLGFVHADDFSQFLLGHMVLRFVLKELLAKIPAESLKRCGVRRVVKITNSVALNLHVKCIKSMGSKMTFFAIIPNRICFLGWLLVSICTALNCHANPSNCESQLLDSPGVARLKDLTAHPKDPVDINSPHSPHGPNVIIYGLPSNAKFIAVKGDEIFRHYTDEETHKIICGTSQLIAGSVAYVETGFGRKTYKHVTGIFMTRPEYSPIAVGVDPRGNGVPVDFLLPEKTQILEISKSILLIPGPRKIPDWYAAQYRAWKENPGAVSDPSMLQSFADLDQTGGLLPPVRQNIILLPQTCP